MAGFSKKYPVGSFPIFPDRDSIDLSDVNSFENLIFATY